MVNQTQETFHNSIGGRMSVIKFSMQEWNALRKLVTSGPFPYLCIKGNRLIATNKKVAIVRKLEKNVSKETIYIHSMYLSEIMGKTIVAQIKVEGTKVSLRLSKAGKTVVQKEVQNAFDGVKGYPDVKKLKDRETSQTDNKVSFTISRKTLQQILDCSSSDLIHITAHEESIIGKWKSRKEIGFFSQLYPE